MVSATQIPNLKTLQGESQARGLVLTGVLPSMVEGEGRERSEV
jgi:hypothetical protein